MHIKVGDKEANFVGSKNWLGSVEVSITIDSLCDVPCRYSYKCFFYEFVCISPISEFFMRDQESFPHSLTKFFSTSQKQVSMTVIHQIVRLSALDVGCPIMMGGDRDASSKVGKKAA